MNIGIIYSSKTGNTKKIAYAIHEALGEAAHIFPMETAPDPASFDLIFLGTWIDRGQPDAHARAYMARMSGVKVAPFITLGARPDSPHGVSSRNNVIAALSTTCEVLDAFICQGAISPQLIAWMEKLPPDHPHGANDASRARWQAASSHPDAADCQAAAAFARRVLT